MLDWGLAPGVLTEEEEDLADALCPLYDQLALSPPWWLLEVVPLEQRTQDPKTNRWTSQTYANWGRGRDVPVPSADAGAAKVVHWHRSVDVRERAGCVVRYDEKTKVAESRPGAYKPKAKTRDGVKIEFVL